MEEQFENNSSEENDTSEEESDNDEDSSTDVSERSDDDEAQSDTQLEMEEEQRKFEEMMRADQIKFEEPHTQRLWKSTLNRVKTEDDTESDEEPTEKVHQQRKKRPSIKKEAAEFRESESVIENMKTGIITNSHNIEKF